VKVLSLNSWQERGPWRERWELIFEGIEKYRPDIIGFQEIFNPGWAREIQKRTGYPSVIFSPLPSGLMLVSRFRVRQSDCYVMETKSPAEDYFRYVLFAELEISEIKAGAVHEPPLPLAVFNTHLSWRAEEGGVRQKQVKELLAYVDSKAERRAAVVLGDFNATAATEEARLLTQGGFTDAYAKLHPGEPGYTWNNQNDYTRGSMPPMPDRRIDYIFIRTPATSPTPGVGMIGMLASPTPGVGEVSSTEIILNHPNPKGIWPSDHYGLLADFK